MQNNKSKRIVFLCSGGGGNFRFVNQAAENGSFGAAFLAAVLTDRKCEANDYARLHGIDEKCIDFKDGGQRELMEALDSFQPDLVVTTVHRILNQEVVNKFRGKLVNLHYSLLPAFGGLIGAKPVREAVAYGAKFTGVTVHLVDENLDGGKPLVQAAVPVRKSDKFEDLMDVVFRCGCLSLGAAIILCLNNGVMGGDGIGDVVKIKDRYCLFSENIDTFNHMQNEDFWRNIKTKTHD